MDFEETTGTSEWNEQQEFAQTYFNITKHCRNHQQEDNLKEWYYSLLSKVSFVAGILEKEWDENDDLAIKELEKLWEEYLELLVMCNKKKKRISPQSPTCKRFRDSMIQLERALDIAVNSKMPFLRLKKKFDLSAF